MATEKKQSFFGGAAVLAAGVVIVKIIGALFKIPLANILGETGNADFNNAYNIYAVLLTISTAGLPVALSKMISEAKTLGRVALITRPEILIADEPTTALDVTVQKQVLDLIKKLQQDMGTSVILITHDLGVVRQYADSINVMYAGRIVESAPAKELLEHPRHAYTRALMKSIPGLHAKGTPLYTIPGLPPNMTQEPCGCNFRPRNTLGNPALCLTDREPELVEISPGHSVQNCPGCLA